MTKVSATLTLLFEEPFWIGLYERQTEDRYQVCKITFGAEPKDYQVYQFLLANWYRLVFSPPLTPSQTPNAVANPKRLQRLIQQQMRQQKTSTKAQQALGLQHQQQKTLRQAAGKRQKEAQAEQRFLLRQQKKKEKHKGH